MFTAELTKPDGRRLTLYARAPLPVDIQAPSPFPEPLKGSPHLRWHPLRGEWITYAAFRQDRTFLPPPDYDPLAPTTDPQRPTELPAGPWDVAVFDNRFPSLDGSSRDPLPLIVPTAASTGHCEVVVFSQEGDASLGGLPLWQVEMLLAVWGDRTERLARRGDVAYVLAFENRGVEMGVSIHHPHGQIYGYPIVPPVPARMQEMQLRHHESHGGSLLASHIDAELKDAQRVLYQGPHAAAFVPACARYPYEVWVAPIEPVPGFAALTSGRRADLARALKTVLLKMDGLWQRPMPYLMAWYQAPLDGRPHPEAHLHAQITPPCRTRDKLKYLAGTELAAGFFAMDALPEAKARELQDVPISLE